MIHDDAYFDAVVEREKFGDSGNGIILTDCFEWLREREGRGIRKVDKICGRKRGRYEKGVAGWEKVHDERKFF